MNNVLNEMQQLRLMLTKEFNFDLDKAEKAYHFIVGEQPKSSTTSATVVKPDGIYFILSSSKAIHESLTTDEDKRNSIAVGVKMGNRFANVVLRDAASGEEVALCRYDEVSCGSEQFFRGTFWEAMSDWNGLASTNDMRYALNPYINLGENEYIPSVAQLYLILLNIKEVNKALVEAGGDPMKKVWYWSSTEASRSYAWLVNFYSGETRYGYKDSNCVVRPAVAWNLVEG